MTKRTDMYADWSVSPRIVWVESPSVELTVSDNHDTCRNLETEPQNSDDLILVQTAGGEDLGGSVLVGLTTTMQDAQIAFAERTTSTSEGTATSADPAGFYLTDIAADFSSDGVTRGATVINFTDKSACTVITVVSGTVLRCTRLKDGSDNQWEIGDAYKVWNTVQCDITGGNIVAVDTGGTPISPVFPTAFTQIVRTSSASATIAQLEIENIQRLIETQRPSHTAMGDIYYWDPYAGDDNNTGVKPEKAVRTFNRAHDLCTDYNHDVIMCQPGNTAGATVADETITISKNYVFVRGPGPDFQIVPTATGTPTVTITGTGTELSSLFVGTAATGGQSAVYVTGDHTLVQDVSINAAQNHAVHVTGSTKSLFSNVQVTNSTTHGFLVGDNTAELDVKNCSAHSCGGDGIRLDGTGITDCKIRGKGTAAHDNTGYGLRIGAAVQKTLLDGEATIQNNTSGDILDNGVQTTYSGIDHSPAFQGHVWITTSSGITGTNYPRGTPAFPVDNIADARAIADEIGLQAFKVNGSITLDQDYTNWQFVGCGNIAVDTVTLNGWDVGGSFFDCCTVTGTGTTTVGAAVFCGSILDNITGVSIISSNSYYRNTVTAGGSGSVITGTRTVLQGDVVIDMVGANRNLQLDFGGEVELRNLGTGGSAYLGASYGTVLLDSTCADGTVTVSGVTTLTDNSGAGCTVVADDVVDPPTTAKAALIPALV